MFSGNAAGQFLAPMIVYKALNVYQGWTESGTLYDATKSGWFDSGTFERWFFQIFLPEALKHKCLSGIISVVHPNTF